MPVCRVCNLTKPVQEFYSRQLRKAGDVGECKACTKARVSRWARNNPEVQAKDRARAKAPERKAKARQTTKKWRKENPLAYRAQNAVSNAVRDGRLTKEPCLFCGREDVHAHHQDYSKPLDVIWLCPKCHHRLHANFPETEGQNKGKVA